MLVHRSLIDHGLDELDRRDAQEGTFHQIERAILTQEERVSRDIILMYHRRFKANFATVRSDKGFILPLARDKVTLLHLAAFRGFENVVTTLLNHGADPEAACVEWMATIRKHTKNVNCGVPGFEDSMRRHISGLAITPLMLALLKGNLKTVDVLQNFGVSARLGKPRAVTPPDNDDQQRGPRPTNQPETGFTLYHYAIALDDMELFTKARKISPDLYTIQTPTTQALPMHMAVVLGRQSMLNRLAGFGRYIATSNLHGRTPLQVAVETLFTQPDPEIRSLSAGAVQTLLQAGASANETTALGNRTTLALAFDGFRYDMSECRSIIRMINQLVAAGGNVDFVDGAGIGPMGILTSMIIRYPGRAALKGLFHDMVDKANADVNNPTLRESIAAMVLKDQKVTAKLLGWFMAFGIRIRNREVAAMFKLWCQKKD